ncbi:MAG: hypothetical protein EBU90_01770 [Proteobacteria bacterium]|nr:hypothetical protein [Pseudomonadota bacterium]
MENLLDKYTPDFINFREAFFNHEGKFKVGFRVKEENYFYLKSKPYRGIYIIVIITTRVIENQVIDEVLYQVTDETGKFKESFCSAYAITNINLHTELYYHFNHVLNKIAEKS